MQLRKLRKTFVLMMTAALLGGIASSQLLAADAQLERLEVYPAEVQLTGVREHAQLIVTGHYADGSIQDLTRVATISSANSDIVTVDGTVAYPAGDGAGSLNVEVEGKTASVKVTVSNQQKPQPVSFLYDTLAALSKNSCNAGACHGSPSGKGGFRLSLRAFDPKLDELTLIREDFGRRTNSLDPNNSLLLLKPLMKVAHGGGRQIRADDPAYAVIHDWIEEGCKMDAPDAARPVRIDVYPKSGRVLKKPAVQQQLSVWAHYSDGSVRDVTPLAVYSSSDVEVADVSRNGLVEGLKRGEVAVVVRYLEFIESSFITFVEDVENFVWNDPQVNNYIDEAVDQKLKQLKYLPSDLCTDEEFIRRVYLDVIGILPTLEEVTAFAADEDPAKRNKVVDNLLVRPEYSKFWALKWGDLLRLTSGQVTSEGVYKYYRWVERSFRENQPYDEFATELLTATGSTFSNPAANFYRTSKDMNDCVETISQVFLGARLQCAKCHNHPFERWTQDNYYGMAAFFNRVQRSNTKRANEMFIYVSQSGEVTQPRTQQQMKPWVPGQGDIENPNEFDRRLDFAGWLTKPDNPFFARIEVNRIWSQVFGRGIVEPADDFRDTNPPSNAVLLDQLANDFVENGYDRKAILATILKSRTYQTSYQPNDFNEEDTKYFSHYQPRLLSAEQLLDAICHVTQVAESFGGLPAGTKATHLPAPDLVNNEFLKIFGQPERQTVCACERTNESNLSMAIQFFNGPLIYNKLKSESNSFRKSLTDGKDDTQIITLLYNLAVCRNPSETELKASLDHIASKENRVEALEDICWAILNTNEFLFQH
ncbi:MAG: hypothetical protein CMJ82_01835 [Planctomycetaceae bacterium]|nr:hypothetical protein [Planctomycetaceae bacterium]|tara:strand:+ start:3670 stop:6129 length:2460 start_codon:yes stop_codon:yes gene_type:complete